MRAPPNGRRYVRSTYSGSGSVGGMWGSASDGVGAVFVHNKNWYNTSLVK